MLTIAIANQKGGVGKTTVAVNLPVFLTHQHKKSCLIIDLDPQANCTNYLVGSAQTETFAKLLLNDKTDINKYIIETKWGVDLIPSNLSTANVELELLAKYNRDRRLETKLSDLKKEYDFIFIDTPPAVIGMVTLNAFVASNIIYIVCNPEKFAVDGLVTLLSTIAQIREEYRKEDLYFHCLLNRFDRRRIIDKDIKIAIEELVGPLLFETLVSENTEISKATAESKPLYFYNTNCSGFFDFTRLAKEVLTIYGKERGKAEKDITSY